MGQVNEAALFKKVEKKCDMDMDMHMDMDDCCDDRWSIEVIDDEQQTSSSLSAPKANYFVLYELSLSLILLPELKTESTHIVDDGPPERTSPPLYLYYNHLKIPSDLQS